MNIHKKSLFKLKLTVSMVVLLILTLCLNIMLNLSNLENLYLDSVVSSYNTIGRDFQRSIEKALLFGKNIKKFVGMNQMMATTLRYLNRPDSSPRLNFPSSNDPYDLTERYIAVASPDGRILYSTKAELAGKQIPDKARIDFTTDPNNGADAHVSKMVRHGNTYFIMLPIRDRQKNWVATALLTFDRRQITMFLKDALIQNIRLGGIILLIGTLSLIIVLTFIFPADKFKKTSPSGSPVPFPKKSFSILVFLLIGLSQVAFSYYNTRTFRDHYILISKKKSVILNMHIQKFIEPLLKKGIKLDHLTGMDVMLSEIIAALPEVSDISILDSGGTVLYRADQAGLTDDARNSEIYKKMTPNQIVLDRRYNQITPLRAKNEPVGMISTNISKQRILAKQREIVLNGLMVLMIALLFFVGLLFIFFQYIEKRAAQTLTRQYKTIFDNANFGAAIADMNGVLTYVNECMATLHGYKAKELKGKHLRILHTDEQMKLMDRLLLKLRTQGCLDAQEVGHCRKDGSTFPMLMAGTLVRDEKETPQYITLTAFDLSEQKALEEQILQAQKMESIGRLAGGIAHDFNNMLSVILGHANILLDYTHPDAKQRESIEAIHHAGQRSSALTSQILAFARKQIIFPKIIDLNAAVGSMIHMLRRIVGENIDVSWMPGADLWPIRIDPSQVDQILLNLGANARDAIPGVGKLTIETANVSVDESYIKDRADFVPGDYAMLTVSDNGRGMDREALDHVFEPFFTTKEVGKGVGMGMATVYGIVKQNKGFIYAYSEPGKGTTFKIYLPRQTGDDAPVTKVIPQAPTPKEGETVLVVDDDPSILDLCRVMLRKLGHPVLAAATPTEAIRLAQEHEGEIHLLMSDVIMPEMNGPDLARRIFPLRPEIKCLFMSGYTADIIALQGALDTDMNFIEKPFNLKDLDAKIRGIFKER